MASLLLLAALVGAVVSVGGAAIDVNRWFELHVDWRDHEYERLRSLHAGFTRAKFIDELGTPVFDRLSSTGGLREETFQRREYWVQIISDRSGTVLTYAVTSCSKNFRPKFAAFGAGDAPSYTLSVELNGSHIADPVKTPFALDFFGPAATSNAHFYAVAGGGNPSNYKTYVYGLNDVCADWANLVQRLASKGALPRRALAFYKGRTKNAPSWTKALAREAVVNTYGEAAPQVDARQFSSHGRVGGPFQIGADRLLTRTVTAAPQP